MTYAIKKIICLVMYSSILKIMLCYSIDTAFKCFGLTENIFNIRFFKNLNELII